jgi:hypothetical protein
MRSIALKAVSSDMSGQLSDIVKRQNEFELGTNKYTGAATLIVATVTGIISSGVLPLNTWHMYSYIHNAITASGDIYIDGVCVSGLVFDSFPAFDSNVYTYLGHSGIDELSLYSGYIGQVALWNKVLTSGEVYDLYIHADHNYLTNSTTYSSHNNLIGYLDRYTSRSLRDRIVDGGYKYLDGWSRSEFVP